jgi:hypothetical protein
MSAGTLIALAIVRVPSGAPRPSDDKLRRALDQDRRALRLPKDKMKNGELVVGGPYPVTVGSDLLDEYVVWER